MERRVVAGTIVKKISEKVGQPANIAVSPALVFSDFPFERPIVYSIELDSGHSFTLTKDVWDALNVGDFYQAELQQPEEVHVAATVAVVILGLLVVGLIALLTL